MRNDIIVHNDYAEIVLKDKKGNIKGSTYISLDKVDLVTGYKWSLLKTGYVINLKNNVYLHRLLCNATSEIEVDHIDGNPLNNVSNNLRTCVHQNNLMNQKKRNTNKSGTPGVYFSKSRQKWCAQIMVNYKQIHLGRYADINDAILARKEAESKYFGEYARKECNL